jgi:hypothetical protein
MNGRVYDYNVGRFLSVDPFVHAGSQGINPYSYIMNNPLAGTDPSGYAPECDQSGEAACPKDEQKEDKKEDEFYKVTITKVTKGDRRSASLSGRASKKTTRSGIIQVTNGASNGSTSGNANGQSPNNIGSPANIAGNKDTSVLQGIGNLFTTKFSAWSNENALEYHNQGYEKLVSDFGTEGGCESENSCYNTEYAGMAGKVASTLLAATPSTPLSTIGRTSTSAIRTSSSFKFTIDDFVGADALSNTGYRKLLKNIALNGLKDNRIEYVVHNNVPYVTFGSNRLAAARELGITNQLRFYEVNLPRGTFVRVNDLQRAKPPRNMGPPVRMQN